MLFPVSSGKIHPTKKGLVWTDQQKIQSRPGARADLGIEGKLRDFSNGWALSAPINFRKLVKSPAHRHFRMMCDNFLIYFCFYQFLELRELTNPAGIPCFCVQVLLDMTQYSPCFFVNFWVR